MLLGDSTVMNHSSGPPVCVPSETTGLAEPQAGLAGTNQSQPGQARSLPAAHLQTLPGPQRPPPGPSPRVWI